MKIRSILVASLLVVALVSAASAELLVTANPLGQGKWAGLLGYLNDSNYGNSSGSSLGTIAGYVGYGVMDKLDIYINAGSSTVTGLQTGVSGISMTAIGLNAKYTVMDEGAASPVTVAIGLGSRAISAKTTVTGLGDITSGGNQWLLGVGVSKMMAPFVPYGSLAYRKNGGNITDQSQIDVTIGSLIAWSTQGGVFIEDTLQSITPNGGSAYSSNQIAIGVGYKL